MADKKRCVVTGLGLICGVGDNVKDCWDAVTLGHSGIDEVKSVDTSNCYAHKGAEVDKASSELSPENYDRSSLLCIHAANEAFEDANIDASEKNIGVILGSCVGGAASIDKYYTDEIKGDGGKKEDIFKMGASAIANNVSAHFGLEGITANIVNACAAGTMSIGYACDLIREGKGDVFIAGGSDSFSSLAFSGFHALHALDENACSPFNHSTGITLGEGSGILVIESYEHAVERGAKIYCEILGSGVSSDAYHITAPRPDGEGQMSAIRRAVESSALTFDDIDYINAHGTGTAKNDEAEFLSLHTLFDGNDHLSVSSTKSMTGHCLGAAGSIEAVFSVKTTKMLSGFAAGVMIAASVWSLLIPALEQSQNLGKMQFIPAVAGFMLGMFFLLILDTITPHMHLDNSVEGPKSNFSRQTMMVLAVTLHNIPEGMAVGVLYASWISGTTTITRAAALSLAIGIAIQNFPEGAIISMPLHSTGSSKLRAFVYGVLSGIVEPIAGILTILAIGIIEPVMPYLLSFAAGAMIYVVIEELVPEMSEGGHSNRATIAFMVGFCLMMTLDVMLG